MRILICGDRYWLDKKLIRDTLVELAEELRMIDKQIDVVIEGECKGADLIGRKVAEEMFIDVLAYPADWNRYGRAAGPKRNKQMLVEGWPDLVLAFHDNIDKSRGTKNMINQAKKAGVSVRLISHEEVIESEP